MADSEIVYQNIDEQFPIAGQDNDSQGFRDNFASIKTALSVAKDELSEFLTNGARLDRDNNFNGNVSSNVSLLQASTKVYNTGNININKVIEWRDGSFQNVTVTDNVVLQLGQWPEAGNMGLIRMALRSDGAERSVSIIAANAGSVFRSPNWPAGGNIVVDSLVSPIIVDAWSSDGGATVFMEYKGQYTVSS
jgi:hypothetical protein